MCSQDSLRGHQGGTLPHCAVHSIASLSLWPTVGSRDELCVCCPKPELKEAALTSSGEAVGRRGQASAAGFQTVDKQHVEATVFLKHKQYSKAETFICNWETFIL